MERYVVFQFDCRSVLIKSECMNGISFDTLMKRGYEMNEMGMFDDCDYEEVIDILMNEMGITDYKILDCTVIDMEYAFAMN